MVSPRVPEYSENLCQKLAQFAVIETFSPYSKENCVVSMRSQFLINIEQSGENNYRFCDFPAVLRIIYLVKASCQVFGYFNLYAAQEVGVFRNFVR